MIIILILQLPAPSYNLSKWNVFLCFRHAEQLPETVCECGPEAHAAEASGVCHVQRRGRPVPPVSAPHPRFVVQVLCPQTGALSNCAPSSPPERLTDTLKMNPTAAVSAQIFLMFRVLLLRISSHHLTSLWPIMVTELVRFLSSGANLTLYTAGMRLTFLVFPDSNLYSSRESANGRERYFKVSWWLYSFDRHTLLVVFLTVFTCVSHPG